MRRYAMLDSIRGLILLSMIVYHMVWDLVYIYGMNWQWYHSKAAYIWQQSICWGFILLSGFCWSFGKKKWKRGLTVFLAGLVITIVTAIFVPQSIVIFGVLTLLGTSMLLLIPLERYLCRCNPFWGIGISFLLFVITKNINSRSLGVGEWELCTLPKDLYANWFTTYLGFPMKGFYSTDYFSLFPWIFLYATGYYLFRIMERKKLLTFCNRFHNTVLEWIGRHSLGIYLLHQPVIYIAFMLIFI